ncbi:MAG: hypothetical protein ACYTHM_10255 [Planctomycetota bacterium]|jgi:hypothetical protein
MKRGTRIALTVSLLVFGLLLYLFLVAFLEPREIRGVDEETGIAFEITPDGDETVGERHRVWLKAWGKRGRIRRVRALYRRPEEAQYGSVVLDRIGGGSTFAGELPGLALGERWFYYFIVEGGPEEGGKEKAETVLTIPKGAPAPDHLFRVRFEGRSSRGLKALHIGLTLSALIFLLHAFFFNLVFLFGRFEEKGRARQVLRAAYLQTLAGLGAFFIGTIPVGILSNRQVLGVLFEGWPFGMNATETKAEGILLVWTVLLLWRLDLLRARADARPRADRAFPILWFLAVVASGILFRIPPVTFCG